jgi:hypothetical protein
VKLVKGESLTPRIGEFEDNCTMLRYTEDLFLEDGAISKRAVE